MSTTKQLYSGATVVWRGVPDHRHGAQMVKAWMGAVVRSHCPLGRPGGHRSTVHGGERRKERSAVSRAQGGRAGPAERLLILAEVTGPRPQTPRATASVARVTTWFCLLTPTQPRISTPTRSSGAQQPSLLFPLTTSHLASHFHLESRQLQAFAGKYRWQGLFVLRSSS